MLELQRHEEDDDIGKYIHVQNLVNLLSVISVPSSGFAKISLSNSYDCLSLLLCQATQTNHHYFYFQTFHRRE